MKEKVTLESLGLIEEALSFLTQTLATVGIVELRVSKRDGEIFWDTEGGGMVNPLLLKAFSDNLETFYLDKVVGV